MGREDWGKRTGFWLPVNISRKKKTGIGFNRYCFDDIIAVIYFMEIAGVEWIFFWHGPEAGADQYLIPEK